MILITESENEMQPGESIAKFDRTLVDFIHCIESLDEGLFLSKLINWSPRDIVAHLVGWNDHLVKGSAQIKSGAIPFYYIDPGDDFSKVNADIVKDISSTKREELIEQLTASAENLKGYIRTVSSEDYSRDFGVRYKEEVATIERTFEALIGDYDQHKTQIEEWKKYQ